jgi:hypothetical protein
MYISIYLDGDFTDISVFTLVERRAKVSKNKEMKNSAAIDPKRAYWCLVALPWCYWQLKERSLGYL